AGVGQRLGEHLPRRLGGLGLLGGERVDARAVLRSDVVALAHALRRVVGLPEDLEHGLVTGGGRIEDGQYDLGVPRPARADLLVGRVGRVPTGVADGGRVHAVRLPV